VPTDQGLRVVRYSLQEPAQTRVHKVIVGGTRSKLDTVVADRVERVAVQYLTRSSIPLKLGHDVQAAEKEMDAQPEVVEVLSTRVLANSLKFSFAYLGSGETGSDLVWKEEYSASELLRGVRVEFRLLNPQPGQPVILVQKDILIPIALDVVNEAPGGLN